MNQEKEVASESESDGERHPENQLKTHLLPQLPRPNRLHPLHRLYRLYSC